MLRKSNNKYCHFDKSIGGLHRGLFGVFFLQSATDGDQKKQNRNKPRPAGNKVPVLSIECNLVCRGKLRF